MIAVTEAPTPEAILSAARRLYEHGGDGFSDIDAATASGVLRAKRAYSPQLRTLWKLLGPYEGILAELGIEYTGLVPPPLHSNGNGSSTRSAGRQVILKLVTTKEGPKVAINTPFDKELIGLVQNLPSREWDKTGSKCGTPKTWLIPANRVDIELAISRLGVAKDVVLKIDPELSKIVEAGKKSYEESRAESSDFKVPTKLDLYPFQRAGVKWIDDHSGRAFIADDMGCVAGDAEVLIQRARITRRFTLAQLYVRWCRWDHRIPTKVRALVDGELHQHEIKKVVDRGLKDVVRLKLKSGKTLVLTPDHEICISVGRYERVDHLKKGDKVLVNGRAQCARCKSTKKVITYKYAKFRGYCRQCMYRHERAQPNWKGGRSKDCDGYIRVSGNHDHPRSNRAGQVYEHILVMEDATDRSVSVSEVVHHKNGIRDDNRIDNLELMTVKKHMRLHGKEKGYLNLHSGITWTGGDVVFIPTTDVVKSIEPAGRTRVFDIVCADPHRNFVANGIIVHNCGKTVQALGYLTLRPERTLPSLVLCPQIVRVHWYREVQHFTDLKPLLIAGKSIAPAFERAGLRVSREPLPGFDVLITNYDLLSVETRKTWLKYLLGSKPELEKYGARHLVLAGHQAVKLLQEAMEKYKEIEKRNRMARVLGQIEDLGKDARKEKAPEYKLVFVNGIPFEDFIGAGFKTLICDESQYVKEDSQRTAATIAISEKVKNAICLTGTPIDNRPRELWTQLKIVQPSLFPSFFDYGRRFCGAFQKDAGKFKKVWDFNGASNTVELEQVLRSTVMIRRLKEDVLKELPPKTRTMIPFVVEGEDGDYKAKEERSWKKLRELKKEREEWKALMNKLSDEERKAFLAKHAEKASKAARLSDLALAEIEEMKQEAVARKLPEAIRFVLGLKETQKKILVFAVHHTTIDRLVTIFRGEGIKTSYIDGRVTGLERQKNVDDFQFGDLEILICGIRAASIGLTLTACHTVAFLELDWSPGKHSQAEDRVFRIGQSKPVTIYYLLLLGSIEEKIAKMIDAKREIANSVLGEGEKSVTEAGILDAVLDELLGD